MIALLLVGCSSWIDQPPACSYDCYDWSDDLLAHILTGPGDGSFDYDPVDVPRQRIAGDYKLGSGEFYWDVTYAEAYYVDSTHVDGYGTAYHNGNLDILYSETSIDMLGDEFVTWNRVVRDGCAMRIQTWSEDDQSDLIDAVGEYDSDDSYHWSYEIDGYEYSGGFRRNLSRTWNVSNEDNTYVVAYTYKPDGTGEGDLEYPCQLGGDPYSCRDAQKLRFDGGTEGTLEVADGADVYVAIDYDYAYDGEGSEHWEFSDGTTCDLDVGADGSCQYACSDGSNGDCA